MKKGLLNAEISFGGIGLAERALFAKRFAVMVQAGMTVTEALHVASSTASGSLKKILNQIAHAVESGRPLSSAFADHSRVFSDFFVQAVYAGETSGTLSENLEKVAEQLEKDKELSSKIKGAMVYPAVVLLAALVLGLGVSFFILPKIIPLFEGFRTQLPPTTRALISFSHFMEKYGIRVILGTFLGIGGVAVLARQRFMHPITHYLFLRIPLIKGIIGGANIARVNRTLGTLLKSGVPIDQALEITKNAAGNYYYRKSLEGVARRVAMGAKLSESLEEYPKLYPLIMTRMIRVGEESGKFEETLFYLADFYEAEVDVTTKSLSTVIEPILLLVIGFLVGGLALAIITPIYEITGGIKK